MRIGKEKQLMEEVRKFKPDIAAFSAVTGYHHWVVSLAELIKNNYSSSVKTVIGGPHATFFPEIINEPSIDFVCRGEGEGALKDLADCLDQGGDTSKIRNMWTVRDGKLIKNDIRPLIDNLDELPFPDRTDYYKYKHLYENPVKRLISGRGCPYDCAFCFNHSSKKLYENKGKYVRRRSPENVIEELQQILDMVPVKTFRFEDDLFGSQKQWLRSFNRLYAEHIRKPFICSIRADLMDEEIISGLKEAGCINVIFGIETGNEKLRNEVLRKSLTNEQIIRAGALLKKYNMNFCTTNIFGIPGETYENASETIQMNLNLKPTFVWCSIFQPYPRTQLGDMLQKSDKVGKIDCGEIDPNYHNKSILKQKDINRSVNFHKFFYVVFRWPWTFAIVKKLVKLPPNPLFLMIHRLTFLSIYAKRWNISLTRAVKEALRSGGFHKRTKRSSSKKMKDAVQLNSAENK